MRPAIHGMVHCSGGAQTKILHFLAPGLKAVKDNLFPLPPLFRLIQQESRTDWREMYQVFNMGHRFELYLPAEHVQAVIDIAHSFGIDAQVVGRIEPNACNSAEVEIRSPFGTFTYHP